jgi:hypothetical protein
MQNRTPAIVRWQLQTGVIPDPELAKQLMLGAEQEAAYADQMNGTLDE